MSDEFVNRITLEYLLNKEMYSNQIKRKKAETLSKEDKNFYRKRLYSLFKDMLEGTPPDNLFLDVKSTCDTFVGSAINYFKVIDKSDIIQAEHKGYINDLSDNNLDCSTNDVSDFNSSLFVMRSIKMDVPTLDKYVTRTSVKKKTEIILPRQKDINLQTDELKTKGLKKNNITNKYEDKNKTEETQKE